MAAAKKSSGVVAVRSKQLFVTPPGALGWANLIEPDDAFDSLKFSAPIHYTDEASGRLGSLIDSQVIEPLWDDLMEELEAAGKAAPRGGWVKPDGAAWVDDHLKVPSEKAKNQNPILKWTNDAEYKDKDGVLRRKTMRAYDSKGALLDLPALKLGMGSIVQAVLIPGLYVSPLLNKGQPAPSFKLQGVRVIQLIQFGAGGGGLGALSDDDLACLGDDVEVADLGSYARASDEDAKPKNAKKDARRAAADFDADDEIPF